MPKAILELEMPDDEVNELIETLERAIAIIETYVNGGFLPENPVEFLKAYKEA